MKIVRIRIRSHINLNFILQQSLTAFGGAPFTQGSLSRYHAFGLLDKPKFFAPSTDAHRALGSPSGRAGAKRLRGITAPISPTNYLQNHRTDFIYGLTIELLHQYISRTAFLHELSAQSLSPSLREVPLPEGEARGCVGTLSRFIDRSFSIRLWMKCVALALALGEVVSKIMGEAVIEFMGAGSVVCLAYSECKRGGWEKF